MPHRKIDGQVYVGEVKEKEKAKKEYEKAVSSGQTAGLVKYVGLKHIQYVGGAAITLKSYMSIITGLLEERWRSFQCLSTLQSKVT